MGAFDGELYALGYRFYEPKKQKTERETFVGPTWQGECVGFCSSSRCTPCPSNNKESQEYFDNQLKWFNADIEFWTNKGNTAEVARRKRNFERTFPGKSTVHLVQLSQLQKTTT